MTRVKLYLYDSTQEANGYRGTDLSAYVLSGAQNTENLTEELDTSELTLQSYPEQDEFSPETKFIIDIVENGEIAATYHRIVQEDVVEKPVLSDDECFTHTITLIEPSAIAQKRIVDNIAVTYKLKDVNLETRTTFNETRVSNTSCSNYAPSVPRGFAEYTDQTAWSSTQNISFGKYFLWKNSQDGKDIKLVYTDTNNTQQVGQLYYTNVQNIKVIDGKRYGAFMLPTPHIMWGRKDYAAEDIESPVRPPVLQNPPYLDIGVASFVCRIKEKDLAGNETASYEFTYISNSNFGATIDPNTGEAIDVSFPYQRAVSEYANGKANFISEYLIEEVLSWTEKDGLFGHKLYQKYSFSKYSDRSNANAQNLQNGITTEQIEIKENHYYEVNIEILNLAQGSIPITMRSDPTGAYNYSVEPYTNDTSLRSFCYTKLKRAFGLNSPEGTNTISTLSKTASAVYQFYSVDGISKVLKSGNPYSALSLVKRAIINSDLYFTKDGVSSVDLDSGDYPFYISDEGTNTNTLYASDLAAIQINEAFYRQKNLWEILLEVGKYAHAIPQIHFGKDDRLAISFYKLGGTNKRYDQNTKVSIMNFRKIDDYLSACSSYVDNLVQLGGRVRERVAPKSSSEDYLVDNNTAQIIVTKPIMEILHIYATPAKTFTISGYTFTQGDTHEITDYVYEEAVYNLLSVRFDQEPNKGLALYYRLGDNVIRGGDYQLPQKWTNAYTDYSFKKVLFSAFHGYDTTLPTNLQGTGPWYQLKVNDFVFDVEYRTKDTARVEHTRPDLRHYLLTSKYDKVPTHKQFNNQQDILVDSVAFGGSMFGKLIRTGNSNFKTREWCQDFAGVKHKGELYILNYDWYYVAKVTNIVFPNHIESIVEYSKDYNQLSEIIGIPSEPRFYEISDKSQIDREVAINDYLLATTDQNKLNSSDRFIIDLDHTIALVFGGGSFLKWANTRFKGDPNMESENQPTFGTVDFEQTVLSPVSAYSCGNTLTYEWDMEDNLSAGDEVSTETEPEGVDNVADSAYRTMRAVQYCDVYGKASLFDFALYDDVELTPEQTRLLPQSPIDIDEESGIISNIETGKSLVLLKDCREVLHFNYNLMQLTDSDTFVLSPFFFSEEKQYGVKVVILTEEVNKMSNGFISLNSVIAENDYPSISVVNGKIKLDMSWVRSIPDGVLYNARSIAVVIKEENDKNIGTFITSNVNPTYVELNAFVQTTAGRASQYGDIVTVISNYGLYGDFTIRKFMASGVVNDTRQWVITETPLQTQKFVIAKNGDYAFELKSDWYFGSPNKNNLFTRRQ